MNLVSLLKYSPGHIRHRLFRDLTLAVLLTTGTLVLVNYLLISDMRRELAWSKISQATVVVREELRRLLEPVEQQLRITRDWGRTGELRFTDHGQLTSRFIPTLHHLPQISALIIADEQGAEDFLLRDDGRWLSRRRETGESGRVTWQRWRAVGEPLETWKEVLDYDPRQRPWYEEALAEVGSGKINWSRPYVFFSKQVPGVTASAAWRDGRSVHVVAIDVELRKILNTINSLRLGEGGKAFLFREDGGVFVPQEEGADRPSLPGKGRFFSASQRLGGTLAFDAVSAWQRKHKPVGRAIQFVGDDERWWGGFTPLYVDDEPAWLGVALPLEGLFQVLQIQWRLVLASALAVLGAGVLLALMLVRKYSRQLKDLPKLTVNHRDYENDIYALLRSGEGASLELKSTMRMNLRSGKTGKEIELAWLKGVVAFMNTDGGIILIGVQDDGIILGLDADSFENEDKCRLHFKNLFNQHVGPEFSQFVRCEIFTMEGKQLVAIECERSTAPVFLHHKNQESFYIRSGPANVELSISRALRYLQHRY